MNWVDVVLIAFLAACGLLGCWRGLFREGFGLAGILVGLVSAFEYTASGADALGAVEVLPPEVRTGVAFVGVFAVVYAVVSGIGVLADRLTVGALPRVVRAAGGALFAVAKGTILAAALVLLADLLPVFPDVSARITASSVARPLVQLGSTVLRGVGPRLGGPAPSGRS